MLEPALLENEVLKVSLALDEWNGNYCNDPIINYLLWFKLSNLEISKENLVVYVKLEQPLFIEYSDFGVMLGNALDNAVEALIPLPLTERFLSIHILIQYEVINVVIKNSYQKDAVKKGLSRGFGLMSIRQTAKRYKGHIENEKEDLFKLSICMLNSSSDEDPSL